MAAWLIDEKDRFLTCSTLSKLPLSKLTREHVRQRIYASIESYYNIERRHTANEANMPPLKKRFLFQSKVV